MFNLRKPKQENYVEEKKMGLFSRLKQGLRKTKEQLTNSLAHVIRGKKAVDSTLLEELETTLLLSDVGAVNTKQIIDELVTQVEQKRLTDTTALWQVLQQQLLTLLKPCEKPLVIPDASSPFVILMVGVNGAGKTTTIAKLAKRFRKQGKKVMLAAGDTFRAAAVEQLQVWGERNNVPVISQHQGADSAAVIYDALQAAQARGVHVLIADTAGRLHTKGNLMQELKKIKRVLTKFDPSAPHEVMLVLDAHTGQNALNQAEHFHQAVQLTGITLTKLDGTAKGGIIFALAKQLGLPIRFIGVGEGIDDLHPFVAQEFTQTLFAESDLEKNLGD